MNLTMSREEARKHINARPLTDFVPLTPNRKAGKNHYICPVCNSGTGPNGTSAFHIYPDTNRAICEKGCFTSKGQDTLGALRTLWACSETEALTRAGYTLDNSPIKNNDNTKHQEHKEHQAKPRADYTLFYRKAHEDLKASPEALEYLHGRGIADDSIERFNLGYCAAWKHSTSPYSTPTRRIIIPRTAGTYTARLMDKPRNAWEEARKKQVEGSQKELFNLEALDGAETPFIVEGELDAISLYQAGASAVIGIGTINNAGVILEEAKKHPGKVFVLALDNDPDKEGGGNPGREAQEKLAHDMEAAGLRVMSLKTGTFYGGAKDGNEAFRTDPEALGRMIASVEARAREIKQELDIEREKDLRKRTGAGMLEDFLATVTQKRDFEPIPTGISDIDRALQGGFIRKTLVMLGAAPGMGKTALAQWIFENMATAGHDVLYINMEMSREQLLARSLSRIAWKYDKVDITALEVMRGYAWTDAQREAITEAAGRYRAEVAVHFVYNPDGVTNDIDSILQVMEAETMRIKAQGRPAPLVCIDYLQLVDAKERDPVEGLKTVLFKLKDFAKRENTVVFTITANNRASNKAGTVDLESGRDTSTLEYTADLFLGLSYTAIEDRRKGTFRYEDEDGNEREITKEYDLEMIRRLKREALDAGKDVPSVCNEISLKVLKNRFGDSEHRANLIFDGKHSTFNLKQWKWERVPTPQRDPEGQSMDGWKPLGKKRDTKRKELEEAFTRAKTRAQAQGRNVTLFDIAEILDITQGTAKARIKEYGGYSITKDGEIVFSGSVDVSNIIDRV